jgi:histidinol-phosphate aminotransferase
MILRARARFEARLRGHEARASVLVKHIAKMHPLLAHCLRLTVGTPEENKRMIDALAASLAANTATDATENVR